jgi:hypothetical protein
MLSFWGDSILRRSARPSQRGGRDLVCGVLLGQKIHGNHFWLLKSVRVFLPFLLPIIERGHGDLGAFGVGMVNGFRVVPKSLLREALREAAFERSFGPCAAAAVELIS